jgi:hypothetical protein
VDTAAAGDVVAKKNNIANPVGISGNADAATINQRLRSIGSIPSWSILISILA